MKKEILKHIKSFLYNHSFIETENDSEDEELLSKSLLDLELDSLDIIDFLMTLETNLNIDIGKQFDILAEKLDTFEFKIKELIVEIEKICLEIK